MVKGRSIKLQTGYKKEDLSFGTQDISAVSDRGLTSGIRRAAPRKPHVTITVFAIWGLVLFWFHPRLSGLLDAAEGPWTYVSLLYFVIFAELAWLYGIYNITIIAYAAWYRWRHAPKALAGMMACQTGHETPVAILYTTCNDFVEQSALSCLTLDYNSYKVYILDDSSDDIYKQRIDAFAARYPERVQVVRRPDRKGYKAGNLNYALANHAHESLFAIVDADEILPTDFLSRLVPRLHQDPKCGFVQANHVCQKNTGPGLKADLGIGVDIHWKWYQPLRNRYGFVMFLGHGALLRRSCWELVDGFPELVSEDLAYALAIRKHGFYGTFAEDVVCQEDFPETVRAFRVRHVKWTRGTCEFLTHQLWGLIKSKRISLVEKLDILFPTLNLPLTLFFFAFMINAGLILPLTLGQESAVTFVLLGREFAIPVLQMPPQMVDLFTVDFYLITVITILAPVLCFILDLWKQPLRLFRFLCHSTSLYAALSPLSALCVLGYCATGKARFLVTGDAGPQRHLPSEKRLKSSDFAARAKKFLSETHPDHWLVRGFEVFVGLAFLILALNSFQIGFFGLALAFMILPFMHSWGWLTGHRRLILLLPFLCILISMALGGAGVLGLQTVFFGFGFHF